MPTRGVPNLAASRLSFVIISASESIDSCGCDGLL